MASSDLVSGAIAGAELRQKAQERMKQTQADMKAATAILGALPQLEQSHPALTQLGSKLLPEVAAGRVPLSDFIDAASLLGKPSNTDPIGNQIKQEQLNLLRGLAPKQSTLGEVPEQTNAVGEQPQPILEGIDIGGMDFKIPQTQAQILEDAKAAGLKEAYTKEFSKGTKLLGAIGQLTTLADQFNEALPSEGRSPLEQRLEGMKAVIGTKTGLVDNPQLLALQKTGTLASIQMVRAFGEVGNLAESDIGAAEQLARQAGLTNEERSTLVSVVGAVALSSILPEVRKELIATNPDLQTFIDAYGIKIGSEATALKKFRETVDTLQKKTTTGTTKKSGRYQIRVKE